MNFLDRVSKYTQMANFTKIRPVGAELFYAGGETASQPDRQTDMTKPIVALSNFANVPNGPKTA
jgi:hypothetical protein